MMILPRDLTKLTEKQYRAVVCHLSRRPISELRKQQALIKKQERRAHNRGDAKALDNLYVMDRIAADALFESEFGPAICRRPRSRR